MSGSNRFDRALHALSEAHNDSVYDAYDRGCATALAKATDAQLDACGYVRLADGADGEPIRPGDTVQVGQGEPVKVVSLAFGTDGCSGFRGSDGGIYGPATFKNVMHVAGDTPGSIADELVDSASWPVDGPVQMDPDVFCGLVGRLRDLGGGHGQRE